MLDYFKTSARNRVAREKKVLLTSDNDIYIFHLNGWSEKFTY